MSDLPIHLGTTEDGDEFTLPLEALRRHFIAIGGTGSGKTVLCKAIVEESIRYRLPVIAVDMQGDLLSLARQSGMVPDGALPPSDVTRAKYAERLDVKIWTPGSTIGIPVSFAPSMLVDPRLGTEARTFTLDAIARGLGSVIGNVKGPTVAVFYKLLDYMNRWDIPCSDLAEFQEFLRDVPDVLAVELDPLMSESARQKTASLFDVAQTGAEGLMYTLGQPLDIFEMFGQRNPGPIAEGRARLSIVYLNHLSAEKQMQFLSLLFTSLYQWMLTQSDDLSGMLYVDEIAAICPPVKKTPAKESLMLLLRQARKYGLCCLLATQTPGDVDYRAMAQCTTQAIGNVRGQTPEAKINELVRSWPGVDVDALMDRIRAAKQGQFVVVNPDHLDGPTGIQARWLATEHRLIQPEDVADMTSDYDRETLG